MCERAQGMNARVMECAFELFWQQDWPSTYDVEYSQFESKQAFD